MHRTRGEFVQQRGRHLGAAGIVHAHEEDFWHVVGDGALGLGQSPEPVGREPGGGGCHVGVDPRGPGQGRVGLEDVAFDGFSGEDAGEFLGQVFADASQDGGVVREAVSTLLRCSVMAGSFSFSQ